jgi:hypothetical protein
MKGNRNNRKKGKTFNSKLSYQNIKIESGTIDAWDFKSVYMSFQSWTIFDSKHINKMNVDVRRDIVNNLNPQLFNKKFCIDIPTISDNERMSNPYHQLEYNLFVNKGAEVSEVEKNLEQVQNFIYEKYYSNNEEFYIREAWQNNKRKKELKLESEIVLT